jgi:hypothetical protein
MLKNTLVLALLSAVFLIALPQAIAAQNDDKRAERTAKVKRGIEKLGTGTGAVAKVTLYDKTQYKGYISRAGSDDFDITATSGQSHTVRYADVNSIGGKNLSTGAKVAIGIGIGVGVTLIALLLVFASFER